MDRPSEPRPGTRLGPYTLHARIGKGATASVYVATDRQKRQVAVKVRRIGQAPMDRRFLREFEFMRLLRVPGVVPVHEAGIEAEFLWFSMDLVHGRPFHARLHDDPDPARRAAAALELGRKLCETLAALHEAGFVHRDVKPSNVLVDDHGDVHVLDFGIGRYFNDSDTLSRSGEVIGTVPFMAPEQLAGLPTDARVDVFATGLMLHEAIAGKRPRPLTTIAWIPRICLERLAPLATLFPEVPLGLSRVVERLCDVDPTTRPSAREAAAMLAVVSEGRSPPEWPDPLFVDPGDWWHPISEGCLGGGDLPRVWVLQGPSGSGRGRIAEQIQRNGLLQGTWTIHLRCRCDRLGGPLLQLLELLVAQLDEDALAEVIGDQAPALRQIWPHLTLPRGGAPEGAAPSTGVLVDAVAEVARQLGQKRPVLLVVHDLEQVDLFTARALPSIAARAGRKLGLLLLHETRWATSRSRQLVNALRDGGAEVLDVPPLPEDVAKAVAATLCPAVPPDVPGGSTPQYAAEQGWASLARWRDDQFTRPLPALWPVSVGVDDVPLTVFRTLVGRRSDQKTPWVRRTETGVSLDGDTARSLARSRLAGLRKSASTLARAWTQGLGDSARPGDVATLYLLAGEEANAWLPAARAAIESDRCGQYGDARRWLLLLDTLPPPVPRPPRLEFDVALAKARVALRTDALMVHTELLEAAERMASTTEEEQRVKTVRAEYGLRIGTVRPALVAVLRLGATGVSPRVMVRALLVAVHCRMVLGQLAEAERELERAAAILDEHPDPILHVQTGNWRAELAFAQHDLQRCRQLAEGMIGHASELGYRRGVAFAASRLGQVLRLLGRRREAEHHTRSAREAFADTGDVYLDAESGLALATLQVERGEALGARHVLDNTIRRIRALRLDHLLPAATRLALQVATLRGDGADAAVALSAIGERPELDPETPAALVRWYRSRGAIDRALAVAPPPPGSWGHVLWRLERARAAISAGELAVARIELRHGLVDASSRGFHELQLYARILGGAVEPVDDGVWAEILREASASLYTEVYLGALEMDARRLHAAGDEVSAQSRWRALHGRSGELGYQPGVEEALGWLRDLEDEPTMSGPLVPPRGSA